MTPFRRFSNSPFTPAPACSRPKIERHETHPAERLRHVAGSDAQGEALDHGGLAHARLAGEDRVVLAAAGEDIDHLPDLGVAAEDRVDLARPPAADARS
jgi:hypothetical protein